MTSSESTTPRWRRVLGFFLVGIASLFAALVGGLLLLMWSCEPPSLETLASHFPRQRNDLETIVSMSDHDADFIRIDPNFLVPNPEHQNHGLETDITPERWDVYRRLFARNGITQAIQRDPASKDAFILVKSAGLLNRGTSNGYLYCGPGPTHRYAPCFSTQPEGEHPYSPGDEAYSYRKLADRWYAFSQGPG